MIKPIRLKSDLGDLSFIVYTILLDKPLTREALNEIISGSRADVLLVINNSTAPRVEDLAYYLYLALRNVRDGVSIARDVNIEAMLYTQCTTQISDAKRLGDPLGGRLITVAAMSINEEPSISITEGDVYIGSISRFSKARCSREDVINMVLRRVRVKQRVRGG